MENLADIAVFVRVVDTGSFTKTADQLGLSRAVVSKYLNRLEARLGARLLHRTTRRLSLTEAGSALYERSRQALSQIEEVEQEIAKLQKAPRGTLKVNAPMSFGIMHIAPALPEFLARHPDMSVEMKLDDRIVDLIEEGFDLAIRISVLADSSMVARKLAPCRQAVCASPEYLAARGIPQTPEDLREHNCIVYTYAASANLWAITASDGRDVRVPVRGTLRVNNGIASRAAALKGVGIIMTPTFYVGDALRDGRLKAVVLTDHAARELSIYAVYPEHKYVSPKVRAFVEFFAKRFGPKPYWDAF